VTYDEALRVLGLERGSDSNAIRKAYLTQTKLHSPERDPDGFKRVRAAYELLRALSANRFVVREVAEVDHAPEIANPLRQLSEELRTTQDPEQRVRIGREAADRYGTADAYELWIEALGPRPPVQELASIVRAAIARGHASFTAVLRHRCSSMLTDDELAEWHVAVVSNPSADAMDLTRVYLQRGRPTVAAQVVELALEAARRDPLTPRPLNYTVLDTILALFEQGAQAEAGRVASVYAAVYAGDERGNANAVIQQATAELAAVHGRIDSALVRTMAKALRSGRPEDADRDLSQFIRSNRAAADAATALLEQTAPVLDSVFSRVLRRPESGVRAWVSRLRTPAVSRSLFLSMWVAVQIFIAANRGCGTNSSSTSTSADLVDLLCNKPKLCQLAHEWGSAHDCTSADMAWHRLDEHAKSLQSASPLSMKQMIALGTMKTLTIRRCRASGHVIAP
jgi:hypothetical protein